MTGMPELIALFHSFVGLTAVLVGWNGALHAGELSAELVGVHRAEVFIGVFIGAVTFTGSIVAYLKLSAKMSSKPLILPGRNFLNLAALVGFIALTVAYVNTPELALLIGVTVLALALGWHLVASIGGWRYASGYFDAEQLLGMGRCSNWFLARQRPVDCCWCAGGFIGCLPFLHHVQGHEPLVHRSYLWRLRH